VFRVITIISCLVCFIGIAQGASYKEEFFPAAAGSTVSNLSDLTDVDSGLTPSDGELFYYNGNSNQWEAVGINLTNLGDVNSTMIPADGELFVYNSTSTTWEPIDQARLSVGSALTATNADNATTATIAYRLGNYVEVLSIPAGAMTPDNATAPTHNGTNFGDYPGDKYHFPYDSSAFLGWQWQDSSWDGGPIGAELSWSVEDGGQVNYTIDWAVACQSISIGDSINATLDTWFNASYTIAASDVLYKTTISDIEVQGTNNPEDLVVCRMTRDISTDNATSDGVFTHMNQYYWSTGNRTMP